MSIRLSFLGAAETVTGSKFLVEAEGARVLVDCGLFQGVKKLRQRNWRDVPVDPGRLDAVVLTHAHIDHSGYLPRLVDQGYRGPVHCSAATADLLRILLPDSGHLQEEAARYANRRGFSRHQPALPLYTHADAIEALGTLKAVKFDEPTTVAPRVRATFRRAGHILGASSIELEVAGHRIVFSGDVGRPDDPIMLPPAPIGYADTLVLESTYGNRRHRPREAKEELAEIVNRTVARGGVVVIPAFAVGRSQLVLHHLVSLMEEGRIPRVPLFLNSPMAVDVTDVYLRHGTEHRLDETACRRIRNQVEFVRTVERSKQLNNRQEPAVIVSASGMATGGRVLHHLESFAPDPRNTILFAGFQVAGTRGEAMTHGAEEIKIHGHYVPVRAEVQNLDTLSAHADFKEMGDWLTGLENTPKHVYLVHGEPASTDGMRRHLEERFGWQPVIPELDESVVL